MSALADIFAAVRLQLDGTGFEAQATALADKQGKNVGDRMSASLSASLKKAAAGAIGGVAGFALGATLTGANQLDAVTRQLAADAGLSADEAKRASAEIASLYGDNLQGMDAIGAVMAKVHNDLGLTGDAAEKATAKFLKFSTATGQDAADAVTKLDDVGDAWNLTAEGTQSILDKLIVSHQRFGGTVQESEAALAALAPAMTAANLTVDDGIALLNLFNSAGVDAAKAPVALAHALAKVKSPEELKRLVADIAATQDPFLRAQKSADLFGAKAGPQLALALSKGNLPDFAVSMDDAAGATERAAATIEDGFGNQVTLALHKVGGALAEFGSNFGPLIYLAGALGPKFTSAILGGLGSLAGLLLPRIAEQLGLTLPSWLGGGTAAGTAMAGAEATAVAEGGPLVAGGVLAQGPEVEAAAGTVGTAAGTKMAGMAAAALAALPLVVTATVVFSAKDEADKWQSHINDAGAVIASGDIARMQALRAELAAIKPTLFGGPSAVEWKGAAEGVNLLDAAISKATASATEWDHGWSAAASDVAATASTIPDAYSQDLDKRMTVRANRLAESATVPITDHMKTARTSVLDTLGGIVQAYKDKWSDLITISNDAAALIYGPQSRASALAANQREQAAQREIIASKSATKQEKADAKDRLLALQQEGLGIRIEMAGRGELTKTAYNQLITDLQKQAKSGNQEVANAAKLALAELARLKAAWNALPPTLRNQVTNTHGKYAGGPVQMGQPYTVNEQRLGGPGEIFVAPLDGRILSHADSMAAVSAGSQAAPGGTVNYNIPVTVQGYVRARNGLEIAQQARRFARLGTFSLPAPLQLPEGAG